MGNIKVKYSSVFAVIALMVMLLMPSSVRAGRSDVFNALPDAGGQLLAQAYDNKKSSIDEESSYDYDAEKEWQESTPSGNSSGDDFSFSGESFGSKLKKSVPYISSAIGVLALIAGFFLIIALATRRKGSGSSAPILLGCGCCTFIVIASVAVLIFALLYNIGSSDDSKFRYDPTEETFDKEAVSQSTSEGGGETSVDEYRDPNDPDYTPARYAIKAGTDGGNWNTLQSGETVYEYSISGEYARSVWVNDGGKLYYVDASGCKMRNNYAHDGFYADNDGQWDKSKKPIIDNTMLSERPYSDGSVTWVFNMDVAQNGTISGIATQKYSFGTVNTYRVTSFGHSAYRLIYTKDESMQAHLVVLNGGRRIAISCTGTTEVYDLQ